MHVGILGGTGPAGRGLGCRMAAAGIEVTLGSRSKERAEGIAAELLDAWPGRNLPVKGSDNEGAADADVVIVGTPWDGAVRTVQPLRDQLADKVVISMASALVRVGQQIQAVTLGRGSVATTLQAALPASRIAAAFHHLPADDLCDLDQGLFADVLVCADDAKAKETTMALVDSIEGLRPLDAGRLSQAQAIEAFTAVCIAVNIRYKARTYVRLGGI
ncbi:MAG TPA: NADPH-dependent F420 reductase [Acidimicrobiales bacterium]|nr:NADPH-dependent F420 reductase [Acidimicrobiales bacterium]